MHYSKSLDVLRFFAVMLVLAEHFANPVGAIFSAGYSGVTLFFVLSGFLITGRLIAASGKFIDAYRNFTLRRILRIFPTYYLLLIVLLISGYVYAKDYWWSCFTFTYNYAMVYFDLPNNAITHLWTLAVEEQFYLFWPLLVIPMRKNKITLACITLLLVVLCYFQFFFKLYKPLVPYAWVGLVPQFQALGIGAAGALFSDKQTVGFTFFHSTMAEVLVTIALIFLMVSHLPVKFILCPLIWLFWVIKCFHGQIATGWIRKVLQHNHLAYWGIISYGIYLYHLPIYYWVTEMIYPFSKDLLNLQYRFLLDIPVCTILTFLIAWISYRLIELPLKKWKDSCFPYSNYSESD